MTNNEIIERLQKQHIQDMSDALQNAKDTKLAWDFKAAAEAEVKQMQGHVAELARVLKAQCNLIESNTMLSTCASSTLEPALAVLAALPWVIPIFTRLEEPEG